MWTLIILIWTYLCNYILRFLKRISRLSIAEIPLLLAIAEMCLLLFMLWRIIDL